MLPQWFVLSKEMACLRISTVLAGWSSWQPSHWTIWGTIMVQPWNPEFWLGGLRFLDYHIEIWFYQNQLGMVVFSCIFFFGCLSWVCLLSWMMKLWELFFSWWNPWVACVFVHDDTVCACWRWCLIMMKHVKFHVFVTLLLQELLLRLGEKSHKIQFFVEFMQIQKKKTFKQRLHMGGKRSFEFF